MAGLPSGLPFGNLVSSPYETVTYISGLTGQTITFGDQSLPNVILKSVAGTGIPPMTNTAVDTAYQPGAQFVRSKKGTSVIKVDLAVFGDPATGNARVSLYQTLQTILSVLEPNTTTAGTLIRKSGDGVTRALNNLQYVGGFEIEDRAENIAYVTVELVFEAYDPTWRSISVHNQALGASTDAFGWSVPMVIPLIINGQAQATGLFTNAGNINALPVFTFTGPCQNFSITNGTSGQSFFIGMVLNAGELLVIDTRTASITWTPVGGVAVPLYSVFGGAQNWVTLLPGQNNLTFRRDVAGNNQCSIAFQDAWNFG